SGQEEYDQHAKVRQSFLRSLEIQRKNNVLKEHMNVSKDQINNLKPISPSDQLVNSHTKEVLSELEDYDDEEEPIEIVDQPTSIQYKQERASSTPNDEISHKEEGQIRKISLSAMRIPCPIRYLASLELHKELPSVVLISEHKKELQAAKNQPQHLQRPHVDPIEVFILSCVDILSKSMVQTMSALSPCDLVFKLISWPHFLRKGSYFSQPVCGFV
ncbi:hypothetical protein KI387_026477, partial [Taxus chinensis]